MTFRSMCNIWLMIVLLAASTCNCALPTSFKSCSRNLPAPEQCIQAAVEHVRPLLAHGDLGDGFHTPPLEPLALDAVSLSRGAEFQSKFSSLLVNGPSNFVVQNLKADIPKLAFDFTVLLPYLNFTGQYQLKIRLLGIDLRGKGTVTGQFKNTSGVVRIRGNKTRRMRPDGEYDDYVSFHKLEARIRIGSSRLRLDNLFGGDPTLSAVGQQFVNENSDLLVAEMLPAMEASLSKTFLDIVNVIMRDVTFDEMFPDV